jgi:AraC family transcriptional activator FtrA
MRGSVRAAVGLLDGRNATTHWEFADELAVRCPAVRATPEALYDDEGPVLTSAGIAAGVDLCPYMVRRD